MKMLKRKFELFSVLEDSVILPRSKSSTNILENIVNEFYVMRYGITEGVLTNV